MEGRKAKIADREETVHAVIRRLSQGLMKGRRVLVIGGSSAESIDDMRIVTNRGTGETAVALALAAYHEGADTELWMGRCTVPLPAFLRIRRFEAVGDLLEMIKEVDHDLALVPAALSDFTFDRERGKLPSEAKATALQLKSVPKVLPSLKERCPKVIGFKAESGLGEEGLIAEARASLKRYGLAAVAVNDLKDVRPGSTRIVLVKARGRKVLEGSKADVARMLIAEAARL